MKIEFCMKYVSAENGGSDNAERHYHNNSRNNHTCHFFDFRNKVGSSSHNNTYICNCNTCHRYNHEYNQKKKEVKIQVKRSKDIFK